MCFQIINVHVFFLGLIMVFQLDDFVFYTISSKTHL
jgi:hypothetical protein